MIHKVNFNILLPVFPLVFHLFVCFKGLTLSTSLKRDGTEMPSQEILGENVIGVKAIDLWNDYGELASLVCSKEMKPGLRFPEMCSTQVSLGQVNITC